MSEDSWRSIPGAPSRQPSHRSAGSPTLTESRGLFPLLRSKSRNKNDDRQSSENNRNGDLNESSDRKAIMPSSSCSRNWGNLDFATRFNLNRLVRASYRFALRLTQPSRSMRAM